MKLIIMLLALTSFTAQAGLNRILMAVECPTELSVYRFISFELAEQENGTYCNQAWVAAGLEDARERAARLARERVYCDSVTQQCQQQQEAQATVIHYPVDVVCASSLKQLVAQALKTKTCTISDVFLVLPQQQQQQ